MTSKPIKVLLIEDNPADAHLIRLLLADENKRQAGLPPAFELLHVDKLAAGLAYVAQMNLDIILLDLSLPDSQGLATFETVNQAAAQTPIIVLSGLDDKNVAVKAMQQGAQDYLVKGSIDSALLECAIRYAIERQILISDHVQAKAQLTRQALELQRRNADLDEFAHTVAHQVQGLLAQIVGYSSFVEMNYAAQLDAEAQMALKRVLQSANKMNNVLSEILLLASVDRRDVEMIPLDMGWLINEATKRLAFTIADYEAEIRLPDDWPLALGYPSWVEEVWVNYISNGMKYGGSPPVLELGASPELNNMIRFWVKDNGQGISKEDQKKLFKPHTRLRQTRARGEGLGLSIVNRIVRKCGGKVGIDSKPGQGSTFWFSLPKA
jgi:signal transduction histidine kinase